jgi:endonuclease/exonuclease/phosphatase (EEP) superfamily protein YafD
VRSPWLERGASLPAAPADSGIRVAVWNLHKETGPLIAKELRHWSASNQAGFVLLQEFLMVPGDTLLKALDGRQWAFSANLASVDSKHKAGVLTASSHACHDMVAMLSEGTEPIARTPKPMLFLRCAVGRDTLSIVNLHGLNFSPFLEDYRLQLGQVAQRLKGDSRAAIVAGDFNTWSERKLELTDSVFGSVGLSRLDFGAKAGDIESVFGNPIDHIYYTAGPLVPDPASLRVDGQFLSSDHRALFAAFRMRRR